MDTDSKHWLGQEGTAFPLRRVDAAQPLDPVEWAYDDAGAGVWFLDLLRAVWRRRKLTAAALLAALALPAGWFYLQPHAYAAEQEILFGQALDAGDRDLILSVGTGPGAAERAAAAAGATTSQLRLSATVEGSRTLLVAVEHRDRSKAMAGLDAVVQLVRTQASLSSRLQKPLSAEPRRFGNGRMLLLGAAGLLGVAAGVAAAWTLERRGRRIASLAELEQVTGLPVLMLSEETSSHVS